MTGSIAGASDVGVPEKASAIATRPVGARLAVLAAGAGLVAPALVAVAVTLVAGPRGIPSAPRGWPGVLLTAGEALLAGCAVAALAPRAWAKLGLPATPATFFPIRWIRHRIGAFNASALLDELSPYERPPDEVLEDALELGRQAAMAVGHSTRELKQRARLAAQVADEVGMPGRQIEAARTAAILADLGLVAVPMPLLHEPGPLPADTASQIRDHPAIGSLVVGSFADSELAEAVRHHHERLDGRGYPDGVSGAALGPLPRILAVVDTYLALVKDRPYRRGRSRAEAFEELRSSAGSQLDGHMVEALIRVVSDGAVAAAAPGVPSATMRGIGHLLRRSAVPAGSLAAALGLLAGAALGGLSTAGATVEALRVTQVSPTPTPSPTATPTPAPTTDTVGAADAASPSPSPTSTALAPAPAPPAPSPSPYRPPLHKLVASTPSPPPPAPSPVPTPQPEATVVAAPPPPPPPAPAPPASPPAVSAINPSAGSPAGGTTVTISGSGFTGATSVTFGSAVASIVSVGSDGSITVTTPGGSGTVAVTVTTPAGSSAAGPTFAYAPPLVTAISPNNGDTLGGATITITGANFTGATSVSFGAKPATRFSVDSDTTITAVSPRGTDGSVDVTVATPSGTSAAGPADRFLYH